MGKKKTRLEELEDERGRIVNELDIYRLMEDEEEIDKLLVKLKMLDEMIKLVRDNR